LTGLVISAGSFNNSGTKITGSKMQANHRDSRKPVVGYEVEHDFQLAAHFRKSGVEYISLIYAGVESLT
jgi:hypothetical protein